jgi:ElaB/YqjD/DUF883 family membrane-anchored ribosome-binding protein
MEEHSIMADQRPLGHTDKSPAEVGAQVRERAQEAGAQVRDKAQEMVHQGQEMVRQGADTASAYYQQGRKQVEAVENTLEDAIRAKPLQSIFMAAGIGMFMGLLLKK